MARPNDQNQRPHPPLPAQPGGEWEAAALASVRWTSQGGTEVRMDRGNGGPPALPGESDEVLTSAARGAGTPIRVPVARHRDDTRPVSYTPRRLRQLRQQIAYVARTAAGR